MFMVESLKFHLALRANAVLDVIAQAMIGDGWALIWARDRRRAFDIKVSKLTKLKKYRTAAEAGCARSRSRQHPEHFTRQSRPPSVSIGARTKIGRAHV